LKAQKHIHPGHHDQQNSKPGKSRRPISELSIKPQKSPSETLTWVHSKLESHQPGYNDQQTTLQ